MAHRVLAATAAILFAVFVVVGIVTLTRIWPHYSCAGVSAKYTNQGPVKLAGSSPGWKGVPADNCVQLTASGDRAYNLGPAPSSYGGETWTYVRVGVAGWIAWTLAMTLLALAVVTLPGRERTDATSQEDSSGPVDAAT